MDKIILLILDGLGDWPIGQFGGKTPLEAANTPNLDELAKRGICGVMDTVDIGIKPGSDAAHLSILGYNPYTEYTGRGPFEAAGIGMEVLPGDVCLRVNMATVDEELAVKDRRVGRIDSTEEYARLLDGTEIDGVKFMLKPGTAYRMGMVMRGKGLSSKISDSDPKLVDQRVKKIKPLDDSIGAKQTAKVLNQFLELAYAKLKDLPSNLQRINEGKLPANYLLTRGAGIYPDMVPFQEKWKMKAVCVAGAGLYKGIARVLGMDVIDAPGATGTATSDLNAKMRKVIEVLEDYDFVFVHIKGADSLGEDGNCTGKKEFIEKIDEAVRPLLDLQDTVIAITADHSTPCESLTHSADDVPLVIWAPRGRTDEVSQFGETACFRGRLGRIQGRHLMPILVDKAGRAQKFGA